MTPTLPTPIAWDTPEPPDDTGVAFRPDHGSLGAFRVRAHRGSALPGTGGAWFIEAQWGAEPGVRLKIGEARADDAGRARDAAALLLVRWLADHAHQARCGCWIGTDVTYVRCDGQPIDAVPACPGGNR